MLRSPEHSSSTRQATAARLPSSRSADPPGDRLTFICSRRRLANRLTLRAYSPVASRSSRLATTDPSPASESGRAHRIDRRTLGNSPTVLPRHPSTRDQYSPVSYTHLRAHETDSYLVCR